MPHSATGAAHCLVAALQRAVLTLPGTPSARAPFLQVKDDEGYTLTLRTAESFHTTRVLRLRVFWDGPRPSVGTESRLKKGRLVSWWGLAVVDDAVTGSFGTLTPHSKFHVIKLAQSLSAMPQPFYNSLPLCRSLCAMIARRAWCLTKWLFYFVVCARSAMEMLN